MQEFVLSAVTRPVEEGAEERVDFLGSGGAVQIKAIIWDRVWMCDSRRAPAASGSRGGSWELLGARGSSTSAQGAHEQRAPGSFCILPGN